METIACVGFDLI
jgi:hypothetical protein